MATLTEVKKDMEFYKDFTSLIEVLKSIAIFQFHALQKKIISFAEFLKVVGTFVEFIDVKRVRHPFVYPGKRPQVIIAVTSETGLLGGLNNKVVTGALGLLKSENDKILTIGQQGQNLLKAIQRKCESFSTITDENRPMQALRIRDYIFAQAMKNGFGTVKIVYPIALSIAVQRVVQLDLLPCTSWIKEYSTEHPFTQEDVLRESSSGDIIEYLAYFWIGYKMFEVLQMSRLAEYAARVIHLEESTQKIKDINKKLRLQYTRACHEVVDQQMRELFTARALFAK